MLIVINNAESAPDLAATTCCATGSSQEEHELRQWADNILSLGEELYGVVEESRRATQNKEPA